MQYEKEPLRKALVKRKAMAKLTTDMTKLSSLNILRYLYKRHKADVWVVAFFGSWAVYAFIKLG